MHTITQPVCTEHLLCAKHYSKHLVYIGEKSQEMYNLAGYMFLKNFRNLNY